MCVTQGSQQAASKGIYLVVPVSLAVAGLGSDWMVAGRPCELANALTVVSAGKLCSRPLGGAIRRLPNLNHQTTQQIQRDDLEIIQTV